MYDCCSLLHLSSFTFVISPSFSHTHYPASSVYITLNLYNYYFPFLCLDIWQTQCIDSVYWPLPSFVSALPSSFHYYFFLLLFLSSLAVFYLCFPTFQLAILSFASSLSLSHHSSSLEAFNFFPSLPSLLLFHLCIPSFYQYSFFSLFSSYLYLLSYPCYLSLLSLFLCPHFNSSFSLCAFHHSWHPSLHLSLTSFLPPFLSVGVQGSASHQSFPQEKMSLLGAILPSVVAAIAQGTEGRCGGVCVCVWWVCQSNVDCEDKEASVSWPWLTLTWCVPPGLVSWCLGD